ncbi:MAG: SafA/ExsA family spore coat assembly protein [Clostridia bacterium]|nr:SafA/ExsA family spore coat assembly protein [Clostridia bacterium]
MKRFLTFVSGVVAALTVFAFGVSAASYTVVKGDTLWRIASRHQVGVSELKAANPSIKNPDLIYPGDIITIPTADTAVADYERGRTACKCRTLKARLKAAFFGLGAFPRCEI